MDAGIFHHRFIVNIKISTSHYPAYIIHYSLSSAQREVLIANWVCLEAPTCTLFPWTIFRSLQTSLLLIFAGNFEEENAHCHKKYRDYFVLPQTLPSELQAQEVLIFNQPDIFCQPELKKKNNNLQTSANNLQNNLQTV